MGRQAWNEETKSGLPLAHVQDVAAPSPAAAAAAAAACTAFCPRLVLAHCRGARLRETCDAVVALLDLAGFSDLVAKCSAGESDMEQLFEDINSCFRAEIDLLQEYGADVLSFLGDGLLAFWPVGPLADEPEAHPRAGAGAAEESGGEADEGGRLASALSLRAAAAAECALRVQERFAAGVAGGMKLRIAISAGPLRLYVAGIGGPSPPKSRPASRLSEAAACTPGDPGASREAEAARAVLQRGDGSAVPGRMVFFVKGGAVTEAGDALGDISPGQVALCASLMRHIPPAALVAAPGGRGARGEASSSRRELLGLPSRSFRRQPQASGPSSGLQDAAGESGAESAGEDPIASSGGSARGRSGRTERGSPGPRGALVVVVVDPSAGAPLAAYVRSVLGVPSGSLAGRLRETAPPLETPEQLALASLFVPYTARPAAPRLASAAGGADGGVFSQVRARLDQVSGLGAVDPARYLAEFRPVRPAPPARPASPSLSDPNGSCALPSDQVSVLFGSLGLLQTEGGGGDAGEGDGTGPAAVRRAVRTVQALLYAHEGSLRQIVLDDDAARCAACALDVQEAMEAAGVGCALGLATGLAFCAFVGDPASRCEFSVFGNAVNRAARLMGKAGLSGAGILADGETRAAAEKHVEMEAAGEYKLKGIPGTTAAFRPLHLRAQRSRRPSGAFGRAAKDDALAGRGAEMALIRELLEASAGPGAADSKRPAAVLVLTGETGLGKSALARAAAAMAAAAGWRTAATAALPTERQPFAAWRPLLAALFCALILPQAGALLSEEPGLDPAVAGDLEALLPAPAHLDSAAAAAAAAGDRPQAVSRRRPSLQWAPASSSSDGRAVGGPSSAAVGHARQSHGQRPRAAAPAAPSALPAEERAAQLRALLVRLVLSRAAAGPRPFLLVFEGVPARRGQPEPGGAAPPGRGCFAGARGRGRLLLVVTGRAPAAGPQAQAQAAGPLERLAELPGHRRVELLPLDREATARLACARIGAASLSPQAIDTIVGESGGVPFIALYVVERLVQDGVLRVDPATGACSLLRPPRGSNPRASDGLRSALLWRLDRLAPSQLFSVKVALAPTPPRRPATRPRAPPAQAEASRPREQLASIVGLRFSAEQVAVLMPRGDDDEGAHSGAALRAAAGALAGDLAGLCAAGVLREAAYDREAAGGGAYEFALPPLREIVRGLLPVTERRRLHRAFAEFLEARERELRGPADAHTHGAPPAPFVALLLPGESGSSAALDGAVAERLAHHWTEAGEAAAALPYLEFCAAAALERFANVEAERACEELLERYPRASPVQRATWLGGLAEVGRRLGRYPPAVKHCRDALALLGVRVPTPAPHAHLSRARLVIVIRSRLGVRLGVVRMAILARLQGAPTLAGVPPQKLSAPRGGLERVKDAAIAHLYTVLRQAGGRGGDGALFTYCGFALWRHAQQRDPGPHFIAIASSQMAVNMALAFPKTRSLASGFAELALELGRDACTGAHRAQVLRGVSYGLVQAGEFDKAARVSDMFADSGVQQDVIEGSVYRFQCHLQRGGAPAVLERLASRIKAALDKAGRDRELSDELLSIVAMVVFMLVRSLQDRAPEALEAAEEFHRTSFSGGFADVPPFARALFLAMHARVALAAAGPRAALAGSGLSPVLNQAIEIFSADRNRLFSADRNRLQKSLGSVRRRHAKSRNI
eukprot:tig00021521_g22076.t1